MTYFTNNLDKHPRMCILSHFLLPLNGKFLKRSSEQIQEDLSVEKTKGESPWETKVAITLE